VRSERTGASLAVGGWRQPAVRSRFRGLCTASLQASTSSASGGRRARSAWPDTAGLKPDRGAGGRKLALGPWLDELIAVRALAVDAEAGALLPSAEQIAGVALTADLRADADSMSGQSGSIWSTGSLGACCRKG